MQLSGAAEFSTLAHIYSLLWRLFIPVSLVPSGQGEDSSWAAPGVQATISSSIFAPHPQAHQGVTVCLYSFPSIAFLINNS